MFPSISSHFMHLISSSPFDFISLQPECDCSLTTKVMEVLFYLLRIWFNGHRRHRLWSNPKCRLAFTRILLLAESSKNYLSAILRAFLGRTDTKRHILAIECIADMANWWSLSIRKLAKTHALAFAWPMACALYLQPSMDERDTRWETWSCPCLEHPSVNVTCLVSSSSLNICTAEAIARSLQGWAFDWKQHRNPDSSAAHMCRCTPRSFKELNTNMIRASKSLQSTDIATLLLIFVSQYPSLFVLWAPSFAFCCLGITLPCFIQIRSA